MAIDMSQFHQVFFEETGEHLSTLENLLLALNIDAPDPEQLNAIFRAAHSIKGSAGTFGFTDLADVTHILENLLDRIRKGEIRLREDMIDAFLDAGDVLKGMLAAHRGTGAAGVLDAGAVESVCQRLRELMTDTASVAVPPAPTLVSTAEPAGTSDFDLFFTLEGDAEANEKTIGILMAELATHGAASIVERAAATDQPWHLRLAEAFDIEQVRGMIEFVARTDSIRILPAGTLAADAADDAAYGFFTDSAPAADEAYGFFEPEPESVPEPVAPAIAPDVAYGFFEPLPVVVEGPPPTPAVPKPVEKEAQKNTPVLAQGGDASIRVGVDKVDQLINLIGELVITQAMLTQSAAQVDPVAFERMHDGLAQLERNTRDLQEAVMSIRMMPISVVFSRFPRVVRDISHKLGKQVELKLHGEETELDKGLIERIADPLTHLVRNSLDHGIESPEARVAQGKPPVGTITMKAYHQSGNIVIEVGDDGAGLNRERILAKARERGFNVHDQMSDQEVFQLIFEAGFSTAEQVTEVSGRGVGMDVVRRNIAALGGRVEITSLPGSGTRITVRLPLTLAILDGMSVAVGGETYIIPLGYVIESLQAERGMLKSIAGVERLIQVRDEYLPVVALHEIFRVPGAAAALDAGIMIVVEADATRAALFVDAMLGQHQVVIKSLESNYRKVPGVSGATIMGDGRVALILDVPMLAEMARHALSAAA
jgi:two-component system chemotaxis sensor kinase CheA